MKKLILIMSLYVGIQSVKSQNIVIKNDSLNETIYATAPDFIDNRLRWQKDSAGTHIDSGVVYLPNIWTDWLQTTERNGVAGLADITTQLDVFTVMLFERNSLDLNINKWHLQ